MKITKEQIQQFISTFNDKLPGGVSKDEFYKSVKDIGIDEWIKGVNVELEHTDDLKLAFEIAADHLIGDNDPTYYTKLATIHKEIRREAKAVLKEIKFDKAKVQSLLKKSKFLQHIVRTKKPSTQVLYNDYILPDSDLRGQYLKESKNLKEGFTSEEYQELRDFIRMEIASLFFDLYKRKSTWLK